MEIPTSVTEIGDDVFSGCSKLKDLTIPTGLTNSLSAFGPRTTTPLGVDYLLTDTPNSADFDPMEEFSLGLQKEHGCPVRNSRAIYTVIAVMYAAS